MPMQGCVQQQLIYPSACPTCPPCPASLPSCSFAVQNQLSGASFSIVQVTPKGTQLLADRSQRLRLMLPAHLEAEEAKRQQKEAVERQRAAAREAAQQVRDEEVMEKQQLLEVLKRSRKATADNLGQVGAPACRPTLNASEYTQQQSQATYGEKWEPPGLLAAVVSCWVRLLLQIKCLVYCSRHQLRLKAHGQTCRQTEDTAWRLRSL